MTKHLANWVNHVKKWAQDHDLKYGQALKNADCRQAYKNGSGSEVEVSDVKPKRKYVRKSKVEPTELPKEVLEVIQKRKYTRKTPAIPSPI